MNLQPKADWSQPQRQATAGLLIILYKAILTFIKAIWPILVIILFRNNTKDSTGLKLIMVAIGVLVVAGALINFYFFRYNIKGGELLIRKGFINKKNITIPLSNIQAVNIEQGWLHQLLKIVKIKIDTAGTDEAEASIDAISMQKASMLRSFLLEQSGQAITPQPHSGKPLVTLSFTEVLKLGLTANHIQTFFIILAFSMSMYQNLDDIFGSLFEQFIADSSSQITFTSKVMLALGIMVLIISIIVSVVRMALQYFDFTLAKDDKGFRIQSGLIQVKQSLVPYSKVQYVSWSANWIRRVLRIYIFEFHQANRNEEKRIQKSQVPVFHPGTIELLLSDYHANIYGKAITTFYIHPLYAWRKTLVGALPVSVLLTGIGFIYLGFPALVFLGLIPYVLISTRLYVKNYRLYFDRDALQVHSGVWGRSEKILQWYKIQKVTIQQSIYQKNKGLASITCYTAAGNIRIPFIKLEEANLLKNYALYKIESTARSWL